MVVPTTIRVRALECWLKTQVISHVVPPTAARTSDDRPAIRIEYVALCHALVLASISADPSPCQSIGDHLCTTGG